MAIDSKRIAKNTVFLYTRLIFVLGVSLYTSRVVLDKLGVDDYGLLNVIYGVIGLVSFLNGTLSSGTSRFITFALGTNDIDNLKKTFSTALYSHVLLALLIIILAETIGLWYVNHIMVVPPERIHAAMIVYQFSVISSVVAILQVPFTSEIMAHEEMNIYATLGIYEALVKLLIVYLIAVCSYDRLIFYSFLLVISSCSVFCIYVVCTRLKFNEVRFHFVFDRMTFYSILKFSGWNIIAFFSNTLMKQGVIMLFNSFFAPVVVAAQAISNQISNALMQFVENVRQAVNPQVIKLYADGKYAESKQLTLRSAEYVFYLLLLLGMPCILVMPALLDLWLVDVPEYTVIFAQLMILGDILGNFSAAFYTPMVAANKIEKNSIMAAILCVVQFGLLYLLFKMGMGPVWARIIGLLFCCIWSFLVKPYILWKDVNYTWREMAICIGRSMRTFAIISVICYFIYLVIPQDNLVTSILVVILSAAIVLIVTFIFMEKAVRYKLLELVRQKCINAKK